MNCRHAACGPCPPVVPYAEELKQARVLLEPRIKPILEHRDQRMRSRLMKTLASIDPTRSSRSSKKMRWPMPTNLWQPLSVRRRGFDFCATTRTRPTRCSRPSSIRVLVRGVSSKLLTPFSRLIVPGNFNGSNALLEARSCQHPADRVLSLAAVSEHLLDLGETQRASEILRATQATAGELPTEGWGGYARGSFAEELCQIDPGRRWSLSRGSAKSRPLHPIATC